MTRQQLEKEFVVQIDEQHRFHNGSMKRVGWNAYDGDTLVANAKTISELERKLNDIRNEALVCSQFNKKEG